MQWRGRRESDNVEDRRGMSGGKMAFGGIGGLILAAVIYFLGGDPSQVTQQVPDQQTQSGDYHDPNDPSDTSYDPEKLQTSEVAKLRANGFKTRNEIMDFHSRKLVFIDGPEGVTVELSQWH